MSDQAAKQQALVTKKTLGIFEIETPITIDQTPLAPEPFTTSHAAVAYVLQHLSPQVTGDSDADYAVVALQGPGGPQFDIRRIDTDLRRSLALVDVRPDPGSGLGIAAVVIFDSAHGDEAQVVEGQALKPTKPGELSDALKALMRHRDSPSQPGS